MNHSRNVFVILLLLGLSAMCCAGCISLGPATSEILVGDETVGTITVSPTDDLFSTDPSADRIDFDVDLLNNRSFINGLSDANKAELLRMLTGNDEIDLASFMGSTGKTATNEGADFWSMIMNMKVSNGYDKTVSDALTAFQIDEAINKAVDDFAKFLDNIKF